MFGREQITPLKEMLENTNLSTPRGINQRTGKEDAYTLNLLVQAMQEINSLTVRISNMEKDNPIYRNSIADILNTLKADVKGLKDNGQKEASRMEQKVQKSNRTDKTKPKATGKK